MYSCVGWTLDATSSMRLDEAALYTVKEGKVVQEEVIYAM